MKGLTITRKLVSSEEESRVTKLLLIILFAAIAITCFPLLLAAWSYMLASNFLTTRGAKAYNPEAWHIINVDTSLTISRKTVSAECVSPAAAAWLDTEPLMLYRTEPEASFFADYFTDFLIKRTDGIFVQKVLFDNELDVISMPLYFFCYATKEAKEIIDLKEYIIVNTKGDVNGFILSASGEEDELELRFTKSSNWIYEKPSC